MIPRTRFVVCVVLAVCCVSMPVYAHHGTAINYDIKNRFVVEAVVTRFRYAQPHLQIFLDVKDDEGNVVNWACEYVANIPFLIREGWSRKRMNALLPVGTELTVTMSPARSGRPVGLVLKMLDKEGNLIGPAFDQ